MRQFSEVVCGESFGGSLGDGGADGGAPAHATVASMRRAWLAARSPRDWVGRRGIGSVAAGGRGEAGGVRALFGWIRPRASRCAGSSVSAGVVSCKAVDESRRSWTPAGAGSGVAGWCWVRPGFGAVRCTGTLRIARSSLILAHELLPHGLRGVRKVASAAKPIRLTAWLCCTLCRAVLCVETRQCLERRSVP